MDSQRCHQAAARGVGRRRGAQTAPHASTLCGAGIWLPPWERIPFCFAQGLPFGSAPPLCAPPVTPHPIPLGKYWPRFYECVFPSPPTICMCLDSFFGRWSHWCFSVLSPLDMLPFVSCLADLQGPRRMAWHVCVFYMGCSPMGPGIATDPQGGPHATRTCLHCLCPPGAIKARGEGSRCMLPAFGVLCLCCRHGKPSTSLSLSFALVIPPPPPMLPKTDVCRGSAA